MEALKKTSMACYRHGFGKRGFPLPSIMMAEPTKKRDVFEPHTGCRKTAFFNSLLIENNFRLTTEELKERMVKKQNRKGLFLVGALLLALPLAAGASELTDKCDKCHGKNGNSSDEKVPSIAGFSAATIEDILKQYKEGERPADKYKPKDGEETDMQAIAKKLSDAQIKEVAEFYAKQRFVPHKQPFDAKLAEKGAKVHKKKCEKCHSDGGSNPEDDAAILAGQWRAYLERQFDLISKREREVPKKMWKKFKKLKDKKKKALIEYYVSQQ